MCNLLTTLWLLIGGLVYGETAKVNQNRNTIEVSESNYQLFLNEIHKNIPNQNLLILPSDEFEMSTTDKQYLNDHISPEVRNIYINKTYQLIGQDISKCLGVENSVGNWYHFASWASLSAGEVISGKKFEELSSPFKAGLKLGGRCGINLSEKEQQKLFAQVNFQIAIEMIPLGRAFLEYFCTGKNSKTWDDFSKKMLKSRPEQQLLVNAFHNYYKAKESTNIDQKTEFITLASTQQVFSEQMRVDRSLGQVFNFNSPLADSLIDNVGAEFCTGLACYIMRNNNSETVIHLIENVSDALVPPELRTVDNSQLKQLYNTHNVVYNNCGYFPSTACSNWGSLNQRKKFLAAMFMGHISNPNLFGEPHQHLSEFKNLKQWDENIHTVRAKIIREIMTNATRQPE